MENKELRVLVGDDQIGEVNSPSYNAFRDSYDSLASYDFTTNSDKFIEMAKNGNYDALIIDLRWASDKPREGYRVLKETKDYSPIRILHTSENEEARKLGYEHGATACVAKGMPPIKLEQLLKGGYEK